MKILPAQDIKTGDTVVYEGIKLICRGLYTQGRALRVYNPEFIMKHKRGYWLMERI